jgi:cobalt-zinc-cadmium efflux system membrane fusion protein
MKNIFKNYISLVSVKINILILFIGFFSVTSCQDKKAEESHEEEKLENEVALTASQFKTIGIETGLLENRNLNKIIKANGYTTVPPQNSAEVATLIGIGRNLCQKRKSPGNDSKS